MLMLLAFAFGFLGGLTYARMKLITWLLLLIVIGLIVGILEISV